MTQAIEDAGWDLTEEKIKYHRELVDLIFFLADINPYDKIHVTQFTKVNQQACEIMIAKNENKLN